MLLQISCSRKHRKSKRSFISGVRKDNNIIIFNEEEIISDYYHENNKNIYIPKFYKPENIDDYAFIINLLFLKANSSHDKERFKNIKVDSPVILLDKNLEKNFIINDEKVEKGETGYLVQNFIGDKKKVDKLLNPEYKFGKLLKVEYFIENNFNTLMEGFNLVAKENEVIFSPKTEHLISKDNKESSLEEEIKYYISHQDKNKKLREEAKRTGCYY